MSQDAIKEIAQYIEDNIGLVIGTDLHVLSIPAEAADDVTLVRPTGGIPEVNGLNQFALQLQIYTRAKNPYDAHDAQNVIYDLFNVKGVITLPVVTSGKSFVINTARPWTMPQTVGKDEKQRHVETSNWTLFMQGS